jgi:diaminohydroxyphosphoribosylaminopyrimidine deaminase/5-amino-6-(5-phosphoribosylamino)uracil reductase
MRAALAQARRASGRTFPNPAVGAIVFRGERVLGRGATQPPGGPHAEVVALERASQRHGPRALRGATLAVTLEPCCHFGRTPPCTDALRASGVARVLVGHLDPHPQVAGGGVRTLRRAGIEVQVGVLEAACSVQHRGFLSRILRGRPYLTLKLAASLDGRIATARGESRWISGAAARAYVHRLRAETDAVLVGSGTALADDPALTARSGGRVVQRPARIVVDAQLRVPPRAKLFARDGAQRYVLCATGAPALRRRRIEALGVQVLPIRARRGNLSLRTALERLAAEGIGTLLVEGGGGLAAALLAEGLVDEVLWFAAPRLLGGDGLAALAALGVEKLDDAPTLTLSRVRRMGPDLLIEAHPRARGARS